MEKEGLNNLKKENIKKVQKTIYINKNQSDRLDLLKTKTNRGISELIRMALENFFNELKF